MSLFGFRKSHSNLYAWFKLFEFIYSSLNNKNESLHFLRIIWKGFNTVNHKILLFKMNEYGIIEVSVGNGWQATAKMRYSMKFKNLTCALIVI